MARSRGFEVVWGRAPSPVPVGTAALGCPAERSSAVAVGHKDSAKAKEADLKKLSFLKKISSGPGRLCEALQVTRERDNGKSLVSARSDLRIVDDGYRVKRVIVTPRIGIVKSAEHPLRYYIADNAFVSGR